MKKEYVPVQVAAKVCNIKQSNIAHLITENKVRSMKLNGRLFVNLTDLNSIRARNNSLYNCYKVSAKKRDEIDKMYYKLTI